MRKVVVINVRRKRKRKANARERWRDTNIEADDYRISYERIYVIFHNSSSLNLPWLSVYFRISFIS
jgi:hypothetical protein